MSEPHFADDAAWDPDDDPGQWALSGDDFPLSDAAEHTSWLASLPDDIREEYLSGPYASGSSPRPSTDSMVPSPFESPDDLAGP